MKTIILYSSGHLGSATILNRLITSSPYDVVGIVKTRPVPLSKKGAKKLKKHLQHVGWRFGWLLMWQQFIQWLAFGVNAFFPSSSRTLKPTWRLAKAHGIPIHRAISVNDSQSQAFIRDLEPDIIISAYFNQIVKPDVLTIPRLGILNVHPGWLPAYKGAMGYFWVLKNGSDNGGVSVHWMDEGLDTGQLLARRAFSVKPGMTQQHVLVLTAVIGAQLLKRIGRTLANGQQPAPLSIADAEDDAYFPMPGESAFDDYFEYRRFFRIRDVFGFLLK